MRALEILFPSMAYGPLCLPSVLGAHTIASITDIRMRASMLALLKHADDNTIAHYRKLAGTNA